MSEPRDDYLWNGAGQDAEVERLEGLLAPWRIDHEPPKLRDGRLMRRWLLVASLLLAASVAVAAAVGSRQTSDPGDPAATGGAAARLHTTDSSPPPTPILGGAVASDDRRGDPAEATTAWVTERGYSPDYLADLAPVARGGRLEPEQLAHLEACPTDEPGYGEALALAAAHYEAVRDYPRHCDVTELILAQLPYQLSPGWNLEGAKCSLRQGEFEAAIGRAQITIANQTDLSGSRKAYRILLAYRVKATAASAIFDRDVRGNAGRPDRELLTRAIVSWTELRNYARGIGDERATRSATQEISELELLLEEAY